MTWRPPPAWRHSRRELSKQFASADSKGWPNYFPQKPREEAQKLVVAQWVLVGEEQLVEKRDLVVPEPRKKAQQMALRPQLPSRSQRSRSGPERGSPPLVAARFRRMRFGFDPAERYRLRFLARRPRPFLLVVLLWDRLRGARESERDRL